MCDVTPPPDQICTEPIPFTGGGDEELLGKLMEADFPFLQYEAQTNWLADLQILHWINENGMGLTEPYASFQTSRAASSEGIIAQMDALASSWSASVSSSRQQMDALAGQLITIAQSEDTTSATAGLFETKRAQLETLQQQYESSRTQLYASLAALNATIPEGEVYETNYKDVTTIWLALRGRIPYTLMRGEQELLESIARQCPFEGGPAVYWSRTILAQFGDYTYDDQQTCPALPRNAAPTVSDNLDWQVVPNPNDGTFTVTLPSATEPYTLYLFDLSGKLLAEQRVSGSVRSERLAPSLTAGAYVLRVTDYRGSPLGNKLVILH